MQIVKNIQQNIYECIRPKCKYVQKYAVVIQ